MYPNIHICALFFLFICVCVLSVFSPLGVTQLYAWVSHWDQGEWSASAAEAKARKHRP